MRFPDYFGPGSVRPHMTLDDCIVDLKVETQEGGLAGFWKNLSPSVEQLNEGKWDMIYDSDCEEKFGVSCKTGAILVTNSSVTIKGGQNEQEQFIWQVYNTLFKLSEISTERASDSKIFLMVRDLKKALFSWMQPVCTDSDSNVSGYRLCRCKTMSYTFPTTSKWRKLCAISLLFKGIPPSRILAGHILHRWLLIFGE